MSVCRTCEHWQLPAAKLHRSGLVYRDFCIANVVQLGPGMYMLIDLELVGTAQAQGSP